MDIKPHVGEQKKVNDSRRAPPRMLVLAPDQSERFCRVQAQDQAAPRAGNRIHASLRSTRCPSRLGSKHHPGARLRTRRLPSAGRRMGRSYRACGRVGSAVGVILPHSPPAPMVGVGAKLGHGQEWWISIDGLIEWMMGRVERWDFSITA